MLKVNEIISDATLNINCDCDIANQTTFTANAPHCNVPAVNGNDLVTLGYVNSLVGQYSGGYNFFFNYSVSDGIYQSLGQSVVDSVVQQIVPITTDTTNQLVAKFVSSSLGITTIPSGIWNMLIYSEVVSNGGTLTYFFEVYTLTGITETLLFTSASSADVNANNIPSGFNVNGTLIAPASIALTDKIVIKIYLHKDGSPLLVNTYFQYDYYSFIQTTLNAGTTLLSSNNVFTGSNSFTQPITLPIIAFPATVEGVNGTYLSTNYCDKSTTQSIGGAKTFLTSVNVPTAVYPNNTSIAINGTYLTSNYVNIVSTQTITGTKTFSQIISNSINWNAINGTINLYDILTNATINLGKNIVSGNIYIGNVSTNMSVVCAGIVMKALDVGSSGLNVDLQLGGNLVGGTGNILIGNNQTHGTIAIGNAGARQNSIYIGSGSLSTANIDIGNNTGVSNINIGSVSKAVTINGSSIGLNVFPTVSATMPSETSATGALSSNQWVQSVITYLKTTLVNTWTQIQTFTVFPVCLATDPIATDNGSTLCTNKWVQSVITYLKASGTSNTWLGLQTFSNPFTLNYSTFPTFTSSQIGYTVKSILTTNQALPASGSGSIPCNVSISMGVWHISYSIRILSTGTTTFTKLETFMTYNTSVGLPTSDPFYYGTNTNLNSTIVTSSNIYAVSGSGVVFNPVSPKVIQLYCIPTYTTTGVPSFLGLATPVTFLTATRIA